MGQRARLDCARDSFWRRKSGWFKSRCWEALELATARNRVDPSDLAFVSRTGQSSSRALQTMRGSTVAANAAQGTRLAV